MNIHEHMPKIKALTRILDKRDTYAVFIVIFVGISSFFLGRISEIEKNKKPVEIERGDRAVPPKSTGSAPPISKSVSNQGLYVGSKSGTKYHLPGCPSAKTINETNKIWFSSREEAQKAGYSPAGNCKGI
ncbi:MAG: hypothetical protein AAB775_01145 [Patescibacteria group bacterium]